MYEWYINDWVHLMVIHPLNGKFYYFKDGKFHHYESQVMSTPVLSDRMELIETAKEMETNYIVDATRENLPVYSIN